MQNLEQRIAQVRNDREHGSRWLVRETVLILRDLARTTPDEHMQQLYAVGRQLAQARPSMAALASAIGRILHVQGGPKAVAQEGERLLQAYDTATEAITSYAQSFVHGNILTCSLSGTVLDVLIACRQQIERMVVLEGRPRYEGRTLAQALSKEGMAVTLITDAEAAIFLPIGDAVVVGADSVLANGDVINKAGTALLAWTAWGQNIPVYVLCETLKISPHHWSDDERTHWAENMKLLEEKEPEEVLESPIAGVTVRNFYFDHTPHKLISKIITERGVLSQQEIQAIAHEAGENEHFLATREI
jgi:translation initiation factor 2B subunit (eIF-2B alpha/beta/delta family)